MLIIMSLFINHDVHRGLYQNKAQIPHHNQTMYRQDSTRDLLYDQEKQLSHMQQSVHKLTKLLHQQGHNQRSQWEHINVHLDDLQSTAKKDRDLEKVWTEFLNKNNATTVQLKETIEHQIDTQESMSRQIHDQQTIQKDVLQRLESQEALTEKILRQLQF